jgi:hypothetical protein
VWLRSPPADPELPFHSPARYWHIVEGETPVQVEGRQKAIYFYRNPKAKDAQVQDAGVPVELPLVNLIRERLDDWRSQGYPGVTRTRLELLQWWTRDLVPAELMPPLTQGKVFVTNWHVFEPQTPNSGGVSARANKAGVVQCTRDWIVIWTNR